MLKKITLSENIDSACKLFAKVPAEYYLKLHSIYNLTVSKGWEIEKRYICDFHLLFVRGGHGRYCLNSEKLELRRGQIVFLGGKTCHEGKQDIHDSLQIIPIRFGFYNNNNGEQLPQVPESIYYSYKTSNTDKIEFLFQELFRLSDKPSSELNLANISSLLHTILCITLEEFKTPVKFPGNVKKVGDWIKANPLDRSNIDLLVEKSGLSPKYFTRQFKKCYGMSPKSFQVLQRINYAKYLLQESNLLIKEIADQCGYPDQYVFSKQFKSILGISPSEARK